MDKFKINLETFCQHWLHLLEPNLDCKNKIAEFLLYHKKGRSIKYFYKSFLSRKEYRSILEEKLPDLEKWKKDHFFTAEMQREMIRQLMSYQDIVNGKRNLHHFPYYDGNNFSNGVILNPNLDIDYNKISHQYLFRYLFATMFSLTSNPGDLFEYQLRTTFQNNKNIFLLFLYSVEKDNSDLIKNGKHFWDKWIELFEKHKEEKNEDAFKLYLTNKGLKIYPFLIENYKDREAVKPRHIAYMVLALIDLGCLNAKFKESETELHKALESTFGKVGQRQAYNKNMNIADDKKHEIAKVKMKLQAALLAKKEE